MNDRRPATTIAELDVHLGYVQEAIRSLQKDLDAMATKEDIKGIVARMDSFATKEELNRVERKIDDESASSRLKRWSDVAMRVMAIITLGATLWGVLAYTVRTADAIEAAKGK